MTQTDIIELFKSMIDLDPVIESTYCFWCGPVGWVPEPHQFAHEPDCQWIRAMDLLGLDRPGHEVAR